MMLPSKRECTFPLRAMAGAREALFRGVVGFCETIQRLGSKEVT